MPGRSPDRCIDRLALSRSPPDTGRWSLPRSSAKGGPTGGSFKGRAHAPRSPSPWDRCQPDLSSHRLCIQFGMGRRSTHSTSAPEIEAGPFRAPLVRGRIRPQSGETSRAGAGHVPANPQLAKTNSLSRRPSNESQGGPVSAPPRSPHRSAPAPPRHRRSEGPQAPHRRQGRKG